MSDGWEPIETAPYGDGHPYDGTESAPPLLILWNRHHIGIGYCSLDRFEDAYIWRDETGDEVIPEPTHWRPLPEPPE